VGDLAGATLRVSDHVLGLIVGSLFERLKRF
jgi:hypothetical protein